MRVLIVDDDGLRRSKLVNHINSSIPDGLDRIDEASNVDEAKVLLKGIYYDILILDVILPKRGLTGATAANGLALLGQISRQGLLKKPGKIIGITAHNEDIANYREQFESACAVVIEAQSNQKGWREKISGHISYSLSARTFKTVNDYSVEVLTVHGIRTFGDWQNRLKICVESLVDGVKFQNYKYGYFSVASFAVPAARNREVQKLKVKLSHMLDTSKAKHLVIFSHSFGTYLTVRAINDLHDKLSRFDKVTLVLSGSVLKSTHDWGGITKCDRIRVINECGDRDFILWLSNSFIFGCGMAGKVGFTGFNNDKFSNRFYRGGHSLYFKGDDFMRKQWLPIIINEDYRVLSFDERKPSVLMHGIGDQLVQVLGKIKYVTCSLTIGIAAYYLFR